MVNRIDQTQRHRLLTEAVWRILRRDGFEAASVRAVAAEAGLSTGSVRHFFASQDELHVFAMEALADEIGRRVAGALAATGDAATPPTAERAPSLAEAALVELLPLTAETEDLFRAHAQFSMKAMVHPVLQPTARRIADELHAFTRHLVESLVTLGAAAPDTDVVRTTEALDVLLDGLTLRRLSAPHLLSPEAARSHLARFVADLTGTHREAERS